MPAPFSPSEEWIEAFERQNTDDMRKRAQRFARSRARFVARAGGRTDELYVAELVHDALTDTLFGVLTWDPAVVSLEAHVFGAVRGRTKNDRVRALRFRHQSIDASDAGVMCEVETTLAVTQSTPSAESLAFSAEVLDQVRSLAADDSAILRIVDAVEQGASVPREIMSLAQMSEKTWRKARLRLARLVEQLSNHVLLGARRHA
ncbi:MAG TPA: hypothetical protein VIV40_06910 [Kofleriaceae bacterium]